MSKRQAAKAAPDAKQPLLRILGEAELPPDFFTQSLHTIQILQHRSNCICAISNCCHYLP